MAKSLESSSQFAPLENGSGGLSSRRDFLKIPAFGLFLASLIGCAKKSAHETADGALLIAESESLQREYDQLSPLVRIQREDGSMPCRERSELDAALLRRVDDYDSRALDYLDKVVRGEYEDARHGYRRLPVHTTFYALPGHHREGN